ncbi:MAG: AmmeMemoRadiSam system protein A [Clostridia bacterium]|nr:AmmeMemoRadiSam system protein A [Clostridia bacterium]
MPVLAAVAVPHPPILLPEVGRGEEKKLMATRDAYCAVMARIAALKPDTVVLISPHTATYLDYFHISPNTSAHGDMGRFRAPQVTVDARYDTAFVQTLSAIAKTADIPAGTQGEEDASLDHGTLIPLTFLNRFYTDYKLVRLGFSGLFPSVHYQLGKCIQQAADALDRRVVIVASGDLSHKLTADGPYGFAEEGPVFDEKVTAALKDADFLSLFSLPQSLADAAGECGLRSFLIMAGALDRRALTHELLSYEGPFGVGYGIAYFAVTGRDDARAFDAIYEAKARAENAARKQEEDAYVRLARYAVERYVRTGKRPPLPELLPPALTEDRAGVFVSLKAFGQLRGCIGTFLPTTSSIAQEILQNGVSACSEDPRFPPVNKAELEDIVYSVDVLGEVEPILSIAQLDPKRYGVIVQKGNKRGLLLPDLSGVDTAAQQIQIAKQKAGIGPMEDVALSRFEVIRHA